jgi:hypothetical protein
MPITKFNPNLMLITEIRLFERQVSAITFFAEGWTYLLNQFNWGEVLCVPSQRGHAVCFVFVRWC